MDKKAPCKYAPGPKVNPVSGKTKTDGTIRCANMLLWRQTSIITNRIWKITSYPQRGQKISMQDCILKYHISKNLQRWNKVSICPNIAKIDLEIFVVMRLILIGIIEFSEDWFFIVYFDKIIFWFFRIVKI